MRFGRGVGSGRVGGGEEEGRLTCGVRVHGTAKAKNVWMDAREGADSVHTGVNVYAYTQIGQTDIPAMDPGPIVMVAHLGVAARVASSCWVCLAVRRMSNYVLSRGGVVDERL